MPLRRVAQVLVAIWQALRSIQQGIDTMSAKFAALTTAFSVLSGSVSSALAEIATLQQQHQTDLAALASRSDESDDAELASLVTSMQARSQSITDAIGALHQKVSQTTTETNASLSTEGTSAAAADPAPAAVADPAPAAETGTTEHTDTTGTAGA